MKIKSLPQSIIILIFMVFPFGQLLQYKFLVSNKEISIHLLDLLVLILSIIQFNKLKTPLQVKYLAVVVTFSLLFSLSIFKLPDTILGVLYAIRFLSYIGLFLYITQNFTKEKEKQFLLNCLLLIGTISAVFGWIQYLIWSDLRFLYTIGWDDHYHRLTSTFLDPAFTGIILVLASVVALTEWLHWKNRKYLYIFLFLLPTIGFTYSRSSFLALFAALLFIAYRKLKNKKAFLLIFLLPVMIFLLPRPTGSEGVKLERLYSIYQKFTDYNESVNLIKVNPIFGIGFNNICAAKLKYQLEKSPNSHSCSGLDNSLLFITATLGVVGIITFLGFSYWIIKNTDDSFLGIIAFTSFIAVLIHAQFTNTLFYSWVLCWLAIITGISRKIKKSS